MTSCDRFCFAIVMFAMEFASSKVFTNITSWPCVLRSPKSRLHARNITPTTHNTIFISFQSMKMRAINSIFKVSAKPLGGGSPPHKTRQLACVHTHAVCFCIKLYGPRSVCKNRSHCVCACVPLSPPPPPPSSPHQPVRL